MMQEHGSNTVTVIVKKFTENGVLSASDVVIVEYPLTIYVNDNEWITLFCSGNDQYYLSIGFMYSEGIIKTINDIDRWHLNEEEGKIYLYVNDNVFLRNKMKGKRTITTGCGKGTIFFDVLDALTTKPMNNNISISAESIVTKAAEFQKHSQLFVETGGVHACALYSGNKMLYFHEDIGRHNALDKIIGQTLTSNKKIKNGWLLLSGRISSEIVIKASRLNIGLLLLCTHSKCNLSIGKAGCSS